MLNNCNRKYNFIPKSAIRKEIKDNNNKNNNQQKQKIGVLVGKKVGGGKYYENERT